VPYFWSEQFGRMLQYVGDHRGADRLIWRGDTSGPRWAACWLAGARLLAVLTVGLPRDLQQGRRLIESAAPVDAARIPTPRPRFATAPDELPRAAIWPWPAQCQFG
jgi:hypothetical protein